MSWNFRLELSRNNHSLRYPLAVPRSTWNPLALDLKYAALGRGLVLVQEWSRVRITLAPVYATPASDREPPVTAIEARLQIGSRRLSKRYAAFELQSLRLWLAGTLRQRCAKAELQAGDALDVTLRAAPQPAGTSHDDLQWDAAVIPPPIGGVVSAGVGRTPSLLVAPAVVEAMEAELRSRPEVEQGGLLLGRVVRGPQCLVTCVEHYLAANAKACSDVALRFSVDELIAMLDTVPRESDLSIVGWHHTHTHAHPHLAFSDVDLVTHHRVFRAPWNVAALGLFDGESRFCWYGWKDGNVQVIEPDRAGTPVRQIVHVRAQHRATEEEEQRQ